MPRILAIFCLSATWLFCLSTARGDAIDDYVQMEMARRKIPGVAIAIIKEDRLVKQAVYGLASLELAVPVTPATKFQLASMSKEFTAVAVLKLKEEGKLRLDDPVGKFLPDLPQAWHRVTIRHALSHTSGLPDVYDDDLNLVPLAGSWADLVSVLTPLPVDVPGSRVRYNQTGYAILVKIIEKLEGDAFERVIQRKLLAPYGAREAVYGDSWEIVSGRAELYTALELTADRSKLLSKNGRPVMSDGKVRRLGTKIFGPWQYGFGGLNADIGALTAWEMALMGGRVISEASLAEMMIPATLNDNKSGGFGLAFVTGRIDGRTAVMSGGGAAVWCLRLPEEKLTIILLTNLQASFPETFAAGIAKIHLAAATP